MLQRARLNYYLALTPVQVGQNPRMLNHRLDIASDFIQEAADREDPTGVEVSEKTKLWKRHIFDARNRHLPSGKQADISHNSSDGIQLIA